MSFKKKTDERVSSTEKIRKGSNVKITGQLAVMAVPTPMGGMSLLINALGDDGMVYTWDGAEMVWNVQR